jgi:hypothetical protein
MAGYKITGFAGMAPRMSKTLLQDNEAQLASNVKLYSGELRSWKKPLKVTPAVNYGFVPSTIYKSTSNTGDPLWFGWAADVNVVKSPIFDTTDYRVYYTGDGTPKKTNTALATTGTGTSYPYKSLEMGVPAPVTAPTLTVTGTGTDVVESRTYVYTYVSTFGAITEEGPPSEPSNIASFQYGQTATISGLAAPAGNGTLYNITAIRLYRSVAGSSATSFLFVKEVPISTTTTVDTVTASGLGEVCPSATWTAPPSDLQGLVAVPNGFLCGFSENRLFFSEPFQPHAWPVSYSITTEYKIVGLGVLGESIAVMTEGNPYMCTGVDPASMTLSKLPVYEPCIAKRSIAADEMGVMYASPNGIILVSGGGAQNATRNLFTNSEWQYYNPSTGFACIIDGKYIFFHQDSVYGSTYGSPKGSIILDRYVSNSPMSVSSVFATAGYIDPLSSSLYLAIDQSIYLWNGDDNNYQPYEWRSKLFVEPRPLNFGIAQIDADFSNIEIGQALQDRVNEVIASNQLIWSTTSNLQSVINQQSMNKFAVNGSVLTAIPSAIDDRYILLTVICNDQVIATINVTSRNAFRLPSGFKGDQWEFKLNGNIPLRHLKIAESAKGLADI